MPESTNTNTPLPRGDGGPDPLGLIGHIIAGKYRVDSFIGEGGFSKVYKCTNVILPEQKIVVKFFTQVQVRERLKKEARILCKLDHPNICRLIDFLPVEMALVAPFIDGEDLEKRLSRAGPLPADLLMKVGRSVTDALVYAHKNKIAHRDLKPGNIMLAENNAVYLIDFGIAKEIRDNATKTKGFLGTPKFAAPERRHGTGGYDPFISDIYELGVTLFYLATGTYLFRDYSNPRDEEWNDSHTRKLSNQFKRVLRKATCTNPSSRYQSLADFSRDLNKVKRPYRRSGKIMRIVSAAAAALIVFAAADLANFKYSILPDVSAVLPWPSEWKTTSPDRLTAVSDEMDDSTFSQKSGEDSTTPGDADSLVVESPGGVRTAGDDETPRRDVTTPETDVKREPQPPPSIKKEEEPQTIAQVVDTVEEITVPALAEVAVNVRPPGIYSVMFDGSPLPAEQSIEVDPGNHRINVEHESYPLYGYTVSVQQDTVIDIDLERFYANVDSANFTLAVEPRERDYGFELMCNGGVHTFEKRRVRDFYLKVGKWHIAAGIKPVGGASASGEVDSIVIRPIGKPDRQIIIGGDGFVTLDQQETSRMMNMLIYWSKDGHK